MIRCLFKPFELAPCVIEDGPGAYSDPASSDAAPRDEHGEPVCHGCTRTADEVNYDLKVRGHDPIYPEAKR